MRRRYLWWSAIVVFVAIASFLVIVSVPGSHAFSHVTHNVVPLDTPTPTPDASATLQMAQQEEANIQTILNIINVLVVAFPILVGLATVLVGFFGFRGYRSLEERGNRLLENIKQQQVEVTKQGQDVLANLKKLQEEAVETKAAMVNTQTALVYLALGDRLSSQKETRAAIEAYKTAGSFLPDDPQINYVLGRIYSGFGYYDEAIKAFEAARAAKSDYAEAEMELGLAYRRQGEYQTGTNAEEKRKQDYRQAEEHLLCAIQLRPGYDDALSTLGGLYRRENDYEKALEYYERAFNADRTSSYALGNVASLAWYLGKLDKARRYYMLTELASADRTMTPHAEVYWDYYDLALAQLVLGKKEEAMKNYQKAMGETPGVVQFDSVLNVLSFLHDAKNPIDGLDNVIAMIQKEKATKVSLG